MAFGFSEAVLACCRVVFELKKIQKARRKRDTYRLLDAGRVVNKSTTSLVILEGIPPKTNAKSMCPRITCVILTTSTIPIYPAQPKIIHNLALHYCYIVTKPESSLASFLIPMFV